MFPILIYSCWWLNLHFCLWMEPSICEKKADAPPKWDQNQRELVSIKVTTSWFCTKLFKCFLICIFNTNWKNRRWQIHSVIDWSGSLSTKCSQREDILSEIGDRENLPFPPPIPPWAESRESSVTHKLCSQVSATLPSFQISPINIPDGCMLISHML